VDHHVARAFLEGENMDTIRERCDTLPFVIEGLMTLAYEEVYEI
jgi:hypothetical protein